MLHGEISWRSSPDAAPSWSPHAVHTAAHASHAAARRIVGARIEERVAPHAARPLSGQQAGLETEHGYRRRPTARKPRARIGIQPCMPNPRRAPAPPRRSTKAPRQPAAPLRERRAQAPPPPAPGGDTDAETQRLEED